MFGYIKPCTAELKVRENELYKAIYCGLCRAMGRVTGQMSRFTLSYDFAFFAAVRMLFTGETVKTELHHCPAHPIRKKNIAVYNGTFGYTAAVAAILNEGKLRDNVGDESGVKRIISKMCIPVVHGGVKRAFTLSESERYPEIKGFGELERIVKNGLDRLSELEKNNSDSLDRCADAFGEILSSLMSFGLEEGDGRIAAEIGRGIGRFIYITDAVDDIYDDKRKHRFNPILSAYGDNAVEGRGISQTVGEEINTAALLDLDRTAHAVELACDGAVAKDTAAIVKNIIYLGMPDIIKKTVNKSKELK